MIEVPQPAGSGGRGNQQPAGPGDVDGPGVNLAAPERVIARLEGVDGAQGSEGR
jgi:hypothetical protein